MGSQAGAWEPDNLPTPEIVTPLELFTEKPDE